MKILRRWTLAEDLRKLYGQPLGTKVSVLWRKSWEEIPVVMASMPFCMVGFVLTLFVYAKADYIYTPKYRKNAVVYRPDDPRVQKINHHSGLD